MKLEITDKLVSSLDGKVLGFLVSAGGAYKVAITHDFGVAIGVSDMDIAEYLDVAETEVVPVRGDKYACVSRSLSFFEDYALTPVYALSGDKTLYYGHLFEARHIVSLNSQSAIDRMVREAEGRLF